MKILWVKSDFLHPTTRGGQIRTLEMLRRIRTRHQIHYVAFSGDQAEEAIQRSSEYCERAFPVRQNIPKHGTLPFYLQVAQGWFSRLPVAVSRYRSASMAKVIAELRAHESYDAVVCDFVAPAPNLADFGECVLFQHNVETMIWRRHSETASDVVRRWYFHLQAKRMFDFERSVCRSARNVIAVSSSDARTMQEMFGIERVSHIATGVDTDYFSRRPSTEPGSDMIFVGSMDWIPNADAVLYFVREVLPLIRRVRPEARLVVVGREPPSEIRDLARSDPGIVVTGTVPDVRPHLWSSLISIVPLRIGGGTRLKIYESMAAGIPVVSTSIGAEGLSVHPTRDIRIADTSEQFAQECLALLESAPLRQSQSDAAWDLVHERFSWDRIALEFESFLQPGPGA
jgi:polysaccharide biosynthesis protein PslH